MENHRTAGRADHIGTADRSEGFTGLLGEQPAGVPEVGAADRTLADLRLSQVIGSVAGKQAESEFIADLLRRPVRDIETLHYRQEIFRDLTAPRLLEVARDFAAKMREVSAHIDQADKMTSLQQRQGWFLDAAIIYCAAVKSFSAELMSLPVASRGLLSFRQYLAAYVTSPGFARLTREATARRADLAGVKYLVRVKGLRVEVSRYDDEPDYSLEIEKTFERFRESAVKDYLIAYRGWPAMSHIGARIVELVAQLFNDEFSALGQFCDDHAVFIDPKIRQFSREIQFYIAYLDFIQPIQAGGLAFCLPEIAIDSKEVFAHDTFDLALAANLAITGRPVIPNDFALQDPERVIVVSGPNQGGKTTLARTFGQLHHLASVGCPVPGRSARLYLFDRIFTHFERQEDIADLTGKLEDDLLRIQKVLLEATPRSIVIMNEIFTSTTLGDARFLGQKVLEKVVELDLLCVYVTFIDELASFADKVVSMASTIVPHNPSERTYKVVRKPADGLAYALAIADKHHVTYEWLRGRMTS